MTNSTNTEKLKICAVTTTRADYGIMRPLLWKLDKAEWCDLVLAVTGTHLLKAFGYTIKEVEKDGLNIDKKISIMSKANDDAIETANIMAKTVKKFTEYFNERRPDVVLLLGDRFETFEVAAACTICRIPIIHIAGGETTEGAIDEVFRHSISKMSYLHLASTEAYRNRIIQLGEDPKRVYNTGALGVENVLNVKCLDKEELGKELSFELDKPYAVVTFHPVTLENDSAIDQLHELLKVLHRHQEMKFIITKANADLSGEKINAELEKFVVKNENCIVVSSLGTLKYFSAIKYCECVIGNSSSGIVEVPSFNKPTINIGDRQKGRIQADSTINCRPLEADIEKALKKALKFDKNVVNPYGDGKTSDKMVKIIKKTFYGKDIELKKVFYDLEK
ncbi:MAG: UDP-N-acetylglucosamine 2-epimerase (hydrolyzing) [Erysipelotrichaceae bacterium]|nr:UDP-N-acetylglucosamine 2-epimerase (hydrolyzing) [Erysipelotrichaceae bacterium]